MLQAIYDDTTIYIISGTSYVRRSLSVNDLNGLLKKSLIEALQSSSQSRHTLSLIL
jgi:hypothetical protein